MSGEFDFGSPIEELSEVYAKVRLHRVTSVVYALKIE